MEGGLFHLRNSSGQGLKIINSSRIFAAKLKLNIYIKNHDKNKGNKLIFLSKVALSEFITLFKYLFIEHYLFAVAICLVSGKGILKFQNTQLFYF